MSELIEKETEEYRKGDPDPFDDRHPGKMYTFTSETLFSISFGRGLCFVAQTGLKLLILHSP